ncbi:MAG TPA: peptidoglycan editing factor PgeF [Geopsychrobacteraceae bacterium]|nr:peptidoglycan editing factor PgeF [Geopsychrobacteraceae bacterium]
MKLSRQEKITYLQPAGIKGQGLVAGFTTRNGGVSRAPYNSLNLGFNTDDQQVHVEGNRSTFCRAFGVPQNLLLTVNQVHGNDLLLIDESNPDLSHFLKVEVDGIVTNQPGVMIGILVADCFPVLLWNVEKRVVAAVHVGWRGAASGILKKTVTAMAKHFNVPTDQIRAAVGPGIGAHSFEVDRPVRDAFRQGSGFWNEISSEVSLGHWQVDLGLSCRLQLEQAGLRPELIEGDAECTCCHQELFFSYRRDHGKTGRQLGFIMLA